MKDQDFQTGELLQSVLDFFSLGTVEKFAKTKLGTSNKNYEVKTTDKKEYFVKIIQKDKKDNLENEYVLQQVCMQYKIPIAQYILTHQHRYYLQKRSFFATVTKKISGHHSVKATPLLLNRLGKCLALFHVSLQEEELPYNYKSWLHIQKVKEEIRTLPENYKRIIQNIVEETREIFFNNLPHGIIHGDFVGENILIKNNRVVGLLDFEEAEKNIFLLDIARFITHECVTNGQIHTPSQTAFLDGYSTIRRISDKEMFYLSRCMKYVIAAASIWYLNNNQEEDAITSLELYKTLEIFSKKRILFQNGRELQVSIDL